MSIYVDDKEFETATFEELLEFAEEVGVGYAGLTHKELIETLRFEGSIE